MGRIEAAKRTIILQMSLIGLVFQTVLYIYVWHKVYNDIMQSGMWRSFHRKGFWLLAAVYFILLLFFTATYGGLKVGYLKPMDVFFSQVISLLCANIVSYFQISLLSLGLVTPYPLLLMMLGQIVVSAGWTLVSHKLYQRFFPPKQLLFISGGRPTEDILKKFETRRDKYNIIKCAAESEGLEALEREIVSRYDGVVLWDMDTAIRNRLLKFCYSRGIRVYMMPKIPDIMIKGSDQLHLFDTPILLTREYAMTIEQRAVKRLIDIVCAMILMIVTAPFMIVTAAAIKLYDGGPVLYKQVRCTRDMREFRILKFRSMCTDAEKDGVARLAAKNDSRITPIGKFIRMTRIDELPQLFNILNGEMSFIGPRPERPEIIRQYQEDMPEFTFRTKVKAGLAGYAQVYGKYNTTPYDKLKLDLFYIENYSVWLDLKLMLLTLKILFQAESTEGVDENQTTAIKNHDAGKEEEEG
ncbi:MAG: exopolysaccharide biosynthesis polyprenyl glycosylphosphotransferase [Lachnospiraceae bacterium]|nr:exopolysaccharide biosynthesis polyprenyl glycosylphosphotransferase [Lachnospiraceae bacterium]MDE6989682.1 exopolysaccharide biosynthesis polyprenyl glycosylphosphotransferase [Lachnospiraceae bacterium]MDE7000040.1 exopolysaccharide biosynthesis polyprenyl glycosylphosphotransferase [Lachnospiraceae bacterium]